MTATRGSWTLSAAVMARWIEKNLDAQFRAAWGSEAASTEFLPFNDTMARPAKGTGHRHPVPYCVYEQGEPIPLDGSSGVDSTTIKRYQDVPFQFTTYGKTKSQAIEFAKLVAEAFDRAALNIQDDALIQTYRDPDFGVHNDDETWSWVLQYRARIDITYAAALS